MRFYLFLFFALFLSGSAYASPINIAEAHKVARRWWQLREQRTPVSLQLYATMPTGYVFGHANEFVVVATDNCLPEILGYGTTHRSPSNLSPTTRSTEANFPPALRALLAAPLKLRATGNRTYPPEGAQWQKVAPLLTTTRHQYAPYNAACPYWTDTDGKVSEQRCIVGCVATAMEQILTYYRRTYTLCDTLQGWKTEHYTIDDVLPGKTVDSRLIRDHYELTETGTPEVDAVARLSYYLGVAAHMNWGLESSGANTSRLAEPLRRAFGLKYVHYLDSYRYEPTAFWNFLAQEIQHRRPVYYAGSIMQTGGHAFVLDGLDERGMFHVNWGYDGQFDGYFRLDVLAHPVPAANREDFVESGFFCNQEALVVCPNSVTDASLPDTLHRTGREVVIESLTPLCSPQANCYTPLQLVLHNTSDQSLTTPFALLLNVPTDTALTQQGTWLNYTGRTLRAHERDTVIVHTLFPQSGAHLLSVSPDGEQLTFSLPIDIGNRGTKDINSEQPQVGFLDPHTAVITQRYANRYANERAAETFIYDLLDDSTGLSARIDHYLYLAPQTDTMETVRFSALRPGASYTFRLRKSWGVVQTLSFQMPSTSDINSVMKENSTEVQWFTLDGRNISKPHERGVYLRREHGDTRKIYFK